MPAIPSKLLSLFRKVENCKRCKKERNKLRHVFGGGKFKNPKFFFLFINPTHKNRSSHKSYPGKRSYPFIGVRHFWKELSLAGFMDKNLVAEIYRRGWQPEDEHLIESHLRKRGVYISNFVKCAQPHPLNPPRSVMREILPLLAEEFRLVNPKYIVTFGHLPLSILTNTDLRLKDVLASLQKKTYKPMTMSLYGKTYKILPCYFLLGHGNPPKAKAILKHIRSAF